MAKASSPHRSLPSWSLPPMLLTGLLLGGTGRSVDTMGSGLRPPRLVGGTAYAIGFTALGA